MSKKTQTNEMARAITTGAVGFRKQNRKEDDPTPDTTDKVVQEQASPDKISVKKSQNKLQRATSSTIGDNQESTELAKGSLDDTIEFEEDKLEDRSTSKVIREHVTPQNKKIQVRHGDITTEDTDAIVNAANGHLAHGGGVAGAVCRAGGPTIQKESDKWISTHGGVETGDVAITTAGRMIARHLIHAVGPIWRDGNHNEEMLLEKCVWNSIYKAHTFNLKSISIPAISSGIFGMPKELVAEIMFRVALKFSKSYEDSSVEEIRFTNFDVPTVSVFREQFDHLFTKQ